MPFWTPDAEYVHMGTITSDGELGQPSFSPDGQLIAIPGTLSQIHVYPYNSRLRSRDRWTAAVEHVYPRGITDSDDTVPREVCSLDDEGGCPSSCFRDSGSDSPVVRHPGAFHEAIALTLD